MGARVLIADDHEMVRRGIRSLLETHYDIEVTEACDGREAVEKTVVQKPDLVILDVSMPLLDGLSAARQIRKVAPETAILFLTFQKSEMLRDEARRIGVIGCLTKGEDGGALLKAIDDAIGGQVPCKSLAEMWTALRLKRHRNSISYRCRKAFRSRAPGVPEAPCCAFFFATAGKNTSSDAVGSLRVCNFRLNRRKRTTQLSTTSGGRP